MIISENVCSAHDYRVEINPCFDERLIKCVKCGFRYVFSRDFYDKEWLGIKCGEIYR